MSWSNLTNEAKMNARKKAFTTEMMLIESKKEIEYLLNLDPKSYLNVLCSFEERWAEELRKEVI